MPDFIPYTVFDKQLVKLIKTGIKSGIANKKSILKHIQKSHQALKKKELPLTSLSDFSKDKKRS